MSLVSSVHQLFSGLTQNTSRQRRRPVVKALGLISEQLEDRALLSANNLLKIDGVDGQAAHDPGWIEVMSYQMGATESQDIGSQKVQKVQKVNTATPSKPQTQTYMTYTLENTMISSYS